MTEKQYQGIRKRVLTEMLVVSLLPFCLILAVGRHYFFSVVETEVKAKLAMAVGHHRDAIEAFLSERRRDLRFVAASYTPEELMAEGTLRTVLRRLNGAGAGFSDLGVISGEGEHLAYVGPYQLSDKIYKDEPWFMAAITRREYISDVFLGFRRVPHFIIAVLDPSGGGRAWILRATVDAALFERTVG